MLYVLKFVEMLEKCRCRWHVGESFGVTEICGGLNMASPMISTSESLETVVTLPYIANRPCEVLILIIQLAQRFVFWV